MTSFVAAVVALGGAVVSAQLNWQLQLREQVRGGDSYIAAQTPPNTQTISEIVAPGAQLHATFRNEQDLLIHYQPQLMDTYRSNGATTGTGGAWGGWTVLHRGVLTYGAGNPHRLRSTVALNLALGKLDTVNADVLVAQSGILPGTTGSIINYTNINLAIGVERIIDRKWHLTTQETIGLIEFPGASTTANFENNPGMTPAPGGGSSNQLKAASKNQVSYEFTERESANFTLELSDVSYEDTATYLGITPSLGYANAWTSLSAWTVRVGAMRYWTNPFPGIVERSKWLAVLQLTLDHTFTDWGLPRLKGHLALSVLPFYNLQFSNLEPRTTILGQLSYQFSQKWSGTGSIRAFTSEYWDFHQLQRLERGHPRNIGIVSVSMRYSPVRWLAVDMGGYVSERSFVPGVQQPYSLMQEFYALLGLTGTWDSN
jgi:hypothetical protein